MTCERLQQMTNLALIIGFNILFYFFIILYAVEALRPTSSVMHQSIPAAPNPSTPPPPSPPRATAGHLPAVSVSGDGHLPNLGLYTSFWNVRGFLSENNYTEDFTGKASILALSRTGTNWRGFKGIFSILCMNFFVASIESNFCWCYVYLNNILSYLQYKTIGHNI